MRGFRRAMLLLMLAGPLAGCSVLDRGFLNPAGSLAEATRGEFQLVCLVMLFVVAPVFLLVPIIAFHYRLSNTKSAYRPQWGFNWPLEILIWIPPIGVVVFLGVFLWRDTHRLDPYKPLAGRALEVQAIAADWKWIFIYPNEGVASVNRLVMPAGRPIHLSLTSATVMQSFFVPRLAGQIYAMSGMRTQLNFLADAQGDFFGENTQFNGIHFQNQKFSVIAVDPLSWNHWLASVRAQPNRLDPSEYEKLTRRGTSAPIAYGAVEPHLFEQVVARRQPSGHTLELAKLPLLPLPVAAPEPAMHKPGNTP